MVIFKNKIVQSLIIDVEPMDIIICVVSRVYNLSSPLASFVHGDLNLNHVGESFFGTI